MNNSSENIIIKAGELFLQYGIRSISMDEVARNLGISKKTLYQHVNNKADLILKVMKMHITKEKEAMGAIHETAKDAIDEMINISRYVSELLQRVNPIIIHDLQKYYQKSWALMESLHLEHTYFLIKNNIERGIEQGLYRPNLNTDITAKLYIGRMDLVIDKNLFPVGEYTISQIHDNMMQYHLYGLMSAKGIELFEKYQNQ